MQLRVKTEFAFISTAHNSHYTIKDNLYPVSECTSQNDASRILPACSLSSTTPLHCATPCSWPSLHNLHPTLKYTESGVESTSGIRVRLVAACPPDDRDSDPLAKDTLVSSTVDSDRRCCCCCCSCAAELLRRRYSAEK